MFRRVLNPQPSWFGNIKDGCIFAALSAFLTSRVATFQEVCIACRACTAISIPSFGFQKTGHWHELDLNVW